MNEIDVRPFGGIPADSPDAASFWPHLSGMNGQSFTHITVVDFGVPGRRCCLGFHTSLETALRAAKRDRRIYERESGASLWIEAL